MEEKRGSGGGCTQSRGGGAEVRFVCSDATDQPGNLRHEALCGHRASRAPEPPVELLLLLLLLYERSLNRSPEVNTDPTHSVLCVKRVSTQGCNTNMNKARYVVA